MIVVAKKQTSPAEIYAITEADVAKFPEADWVHNPPSYKTLISEGVTAQDMQVTDTDVEERDPGDEPLEKAKKFKIEAIDQRTTELIEAGFQYNGKVFSLSRQAQQNLAGLLTANAAGFPVSWPKTWNTLDDDGTQEIASFEEFQAFYGAAMVTVESHLNSSTALKDQVRAATTVAEVEAIEDPR